MTRKLFDHLVLDSAPLLQGTIPPGLSEKVYTVPAVIQEIRDEASRERLSQLPFKLETRSPSAEALSIVNKFAKHTGDSAVLSSTDLQVLALVVSLELEFNEKNHVMRRDPSEIPLEQTHQGARDYLARDSKKKKQQAKKKEKRKGGIEVDFFDEPRHEKLKVEERQQCAVKVEQPAKAKKRLEPSDPVKAVESKLKSVSLKTKIGDDEEVVATASFSAPAVSSLEVDDESDGEWITPENLGKFQSSGEAEWSADGQISPRDEPIEPAESKSLRIACITSDFAMQNVLLQMKLNLYTPDGCRVKNVKNWLLRCHGCYATTRQMDARFCPRCGGATLTRTSFMIDENGACHLFLSSNFQFIVQGSRYPLSTPRGGRQGTNLILREDQKEHLRQREHYNRVQAKIEGLTSGATPFSSLEDIDDKIAAVFGAGGAGAAKNRRFDAFDGLAPPVAGHGRRNPNAQNRRKT